MKSLDIINDHEDSIRLSDKGMYEGSIRYFNYYFSEGVSRAESSRTDKKYQEVKNLGIINSDSMIDDEQLKYITDQIIDYEGTIYDLGCGRGDILSHIRKLSSSSCIGIDKSENMINIASYKNPNISWIVADIEEYCDSLSNFDAAILIDSIYFLKDTKSYIDKLYSKLNNGGKIIITYSQHSKDISKKDSLGANENKLGKILNGLKLPFDYREFTENEMILWEHRSKVTESLKDEYFSENNSFLYYDRISESTNLLTAIKQGLGRRFIYTIYKN